MGGKGSSLRRFLFQVLSLDQYLYVLSILYLFSYKWGLLKNDPGYKYHYFLPKILKKGDHIIDIGANLGYFSTIFARAVGRGGKVYAVEPVQPILKILKKHVSKYPQVEVLPYALGASNKTITLVNDTLERFGYMATGRQRVANESELIDGSGDVFQAKMRKGSELFEHMDRLDFIKCDVEGYETVVIPEIESIISRFHPIMLIETQREKRPQIVNFLNKLNYSPYDLHGDLLQLAKMDKQDDILFVHESDIPALKNHMVQE